MSLILQTDPGPDLFGTFLLLALVFFLLGCFSWYSDLMRRHRERIKRPVSATTRKSEGSPFKVYRGSESAQGTEPLTSGEQSDERREEDLFSDY
jgi:hypothetical protein